MSWIDDLFGMTPNAVGQANSETAQASAPYRNADGRLDPNAVRALVPGDVQGEADLALKLGNMRIDAMKGYEPKPLKWNQWLGGVLQNASIPVSYAQGNTSYGGAMTGNTVLDEHRKRAVDYEDVRNKGLFEINDKTLSGVGESALTYMQEKRKKREEARTLVAKSIAVARARGGDVAAALKSGADYLRSLGLQSDAESLEKGYGPSHSVQPPMAGGAQIGPGSGGPAQPSSAPGIGTPAPQAAIQSSAVLPQGPAGAGPAVAGGGVGQPQGQNQSPQSILEALSQGSGSPLTSGVRETAALVAPYDEETAKLLQKQAENEEAAPIAGAKKLAEERASARVKLVTELPQAQKALESTHSTLSDIERIAGSLVNTDANGRITGISNGLAKNTGGLFEMYAMNQPGGEAADAWANFSTLKNQLGVMTLNAMRETSKTGGAVGNVTEKEWPILQSQIAALDPNMSGQALAGSIQTIINKVRSIRSMADDAFASTYGERLSTGGSAGNSAGGNRTSDTVDAGAPSAAQMAQPGERPHDLPIGATRMINGVVRVKTERGWVPARPADDSQALKDARNNIARRGR